MKRWKLYFAYSHLPPHLQAVSKPFHDLAVAMVENDDEPKAEEAVELAVAAIDRGVDRAESIEALSLLYMAMTECALDHMENGLRQLLRAKDAAVRAHIPDPPEPDAG